MPEDKDKEKEVEEKKEKELSDVEKLAVEIGWNPDYEGDDREFVGAKEYILKSKEIQNTQTKQNKSLKRELEDVKRGMGMLQQHNDTVYKVQVKNLKSKIKELESHREEAVSDGDSKAVAAIDTQIKDLNEIPDELPKVDVAEPTEEFVKWEEKNPWYNDDKEMRAFADTIGKEYAAKNLPLEKVFELVSKEVKRVFPEKFPEPKKRPSAPAVEGGGTKSSGKKSTSKYSYNDLSREQQDACDFFVKQGVMTQDQYIKELEIIEKNQGRV